MNQIIAGIDFADDGTLRVAEPPTDPRFSAPLSGLYWQILDEATGKVIRSRSLWDAQLVVPADKPSDGVAQLVETRGPDNHLLLAVDREVREAAHDDRLLRILVGLDHAEIDKASQEFGRDIVPSLAILAAVLILAAWLQVAIGLRPMERIRHGLGEIVAGRSARMTTEVPDELRPLVQEINRLLESQAQVLAKARAKAADLAHGLKTPLQVLSADIRALRSKGEAKIAGDIDQVATTIRRHVERELARSRAASGAGIRIRNCRVHEVAQRVVEVIRRTPQGERLEFRIKGDPDVTAWIDEVDLAEILGNLAENASRFARSEVTIDASAADTTTRIVVEDDGPGIPEDARTSALIRGGRLDLNSDGAGLGLAIVSDIVEAYSGTIRLEGASAGLRVSIALPKASREPRREDSSALSHA
jgi:signal transduction histidine kinase